MRIAENIEKKGMSVCNGGEFCNAITDAIVERKPKTLIETGTYFGTGTTMCILSALKIAHERSDLWSFVSIEVNPSFCEMAKMNLNGAGYFDRDVHISNALTIPRGMLPSVGEIGRRLVDNERDWNPDVVVDHQPDVRAKYYHRETNFSVDDDFLKLSIETFNYVPEFVLLDSGGHIGSIEFDIFSNFVNGKCILALDDINHVKHANSFSRIKKDSRFKILSVGTEKYGWCVSEFDPNR